MLSSLSVHTSIAISRQTGRAAVYRLVPFNAVVDAPARESTLSNAASRFNDSDIGARFALNESVSNVVFSFFEISSNSSLDVELSSCWNAISPSVAWDIASASSLSMFTVNNR